MVPIRRNRRGLRTVLRMPDTSESSELAPLTLSCSGRRASSRARDT